MNKYVVNFYKDPITEKIEFAKVIDAKDFKEAFNKAYQIAKETNTYYQSPSLLFKGDTK